MRAIRSSAGVYHARKDWLVWFTAGLIALLGLAFSILQTDRLREALGFFGGLIAAMHDRWNATTMMTYWGAGAVIMVAFHSLFKFVLLVPLP